MGAMSAWRDNQPGGMIGKQPAKVRQRRPRRPQRPASGIAGAGGGGVGGGKELGNKGTGAAAGETGEIAVKNNPQEFVNSLGLQGGIDANTLMNGVTGDLLQNQFFAQQQAGFNQAALLQDETLSPAEYYANKYGMPLIGQGDAAGKAGGKNGRKKRPTPVDPALTAQQTQQAGNIMAGEMRNFVMNSTPGMRNGGNRYDTTAPQQGRWSWWD